MEQLVEHEVEQGNKVEQEQRCSVSQNAQKWNKESAVVPFIVPSKLLEIYQ